MNVVYVKVFYTGKLFPAYWYCVKSKIKISHKISDIKLTVLQPKQSVQIRCQK